MKYIASCSFGKDSLAMILTIIEHGLPLDEVVFYDTGWNFKPSTMCVMPFSHFSAKTASAT